MGLEGIVSKRLGSRDRSDDRQTGLSTMPEAPAIRREARRIGSMTVRFLLLFIAATALCACQSPGRFQAPQTDGVCIGAMDPPGC